jgi:tetratricopeptide (TPR) repeat protein
MRRILVCMLIMLAVVGPVLAQNPTTFDQAKHISGQTNKPILLEFFQPDCEFCQLASSDFASNDSILALLKSVVYLSLDVNSGEGDSLSRSYYVENTFPVFVLTDSIGAIINYWSGYSSPAPFIQTLTAALASQVTIDKRYELLKSKPAFDNALFLAKYNNEIGDNIKAAELYKQAQTLKSGSDYYYDIFQNTANAVWNETGPFSQLLVAADNVLAARGGNVTSVASVGVITARVARKVGKTDDIAKYLQAGIDITSGRTDMKSKDWNNILLAEQALYVQHDTAKAISIRRSNLGPDWENKPSKFFTYAKWCLERKIDLANAESYASKAVEGSTEGKFRASILVTLADIYEARGKMADAIKTMKMAIEQDPHNTWYSSELKRMQGEQLENK